MLDLPEDETIQAADTILDEIDKFSAIYYYYNNYIGDKELPYKTLYREYIDDNSPDCEKLKIELGI